MGYLEQNKKTIEDAFAKALAGMDLTIQRGMESLLDLGVDYCLKHHHDVNEEHKKPHLEHEEGGYGWILLHKGTEVSRKLYGTNAEKKSEADAKLSLVASGQNKGWVGIVLASLEPVKYYNVLYEFVPMRAGIRDLKAKDFNKYFKPMSV